MSLRTDEKEIDGRTYRTQQLAAVRSLKLMARLMKILGPALPYLSTMKMSDLASSSVGSLAPLVAELFERVDPDDLPSLACAILCGTSVIVEKGNVTIDSEANLNVVFNGRLPSLFKVCQFALATNFSDFTNGAVKSPSDLPAPASH